MGPPVAALMELGPGSGGGAVAEAGEPVVEDVVARIVSTLSLLPTPGWRTMRR